MSWIVRPPDDRRVLAPADGLVVGLVNNVADRALHATEAQFARLLGGRHQLKLFTCPRIERRAHPRDAAGRPYAAFDALFDSRLDAVIVTGMEPRAERLQDEAAWGDLTKIADRARDKRMPVLWSCLAAHAAVLHMDGIARVRLPAKLSGVFEGAILDADDPLAAGLPSRLGHPHSRYNDLPEPALRAAGYRVLSRSADAGVDIFLGGAAPFVFLQGHPEYDAGTLLVEYKRDVRRYLTGESDEYPVAPRNCLDAATLAALAERREHAVQGRRDPSQLARTLALLSAEPAPARWHRAAARLYANWLGSVMPRTHRPRPVRDAQREPDLASAGGS